jgi:hypothetical protein
MRGEIRKPTVDTGLGKRVKTKSWKTVETMSGGPNGLGGIGTTRNWMTSKPRMIPVGLVIAEILIPEQNCRSHGSKRTLAMPWKNPSGTPTGGKSGAVIEAETETGTDQAESKPILSGWTLPSPKNLSRLERRRISNVGKRR